MKIKINRNEVQIIEGSIAEEVFGDLRVEGDRDSFIERLRAETSEPTSVESTDFIRESELVDGLNEDIADSSNYLSEEDFVLTIGERWTPDPRLVRYDREVKIKSELEVSRREFSSIVRESNISGFMGPKLQSTLQRLEEMSQSTARQLGARLRRVLFARTASRTQYDQEEGRLNTRALSQMIASPSPFRRVYKTKTEGLKVDTHVEILVDLSGSMGGSKIDLASASCLALGDALSPLQSLGVSFGISGFTTFDIYAHSFSGGKPKGKGGLEESVFGEISGDIRRRFDRSEQGLDHSIWFEKGEDWRRARARLAMMPSHYRLSQNADGEALRWAHERLLKVRAERKILIVISDGSPYCISDHRSNRCLIPKTKIEEISLREDGIEVFGLGLEDESVRLIYNDSAVVNSAKDLESVLVDQLSTWLLNNQQKGRTR